ncbi:hypothetical protein IW262DRAFT_1325179 [Armillaria fumosa]|nr:hypothetical protein IW262DRAFT_1325179 [Armillaria fumosa]
MRASSQTSDDGTDWISDPPTTMLSWLKKVKEAESGATLETELDPDSLSWFRANFDIVTEVYRGNWELIGNKAVVTIPTIMHGAFLNELMWSLGKRTNPRELKIGATTVPVYDGMKVPDVNIYDNRDGESEGFGFPTVSIEVSYGETHTKLLWGIIRLVLGLQGHLQIALGINVYSPKELQFVEVIPCIFGGSGILNDADAKTFEHGKVYGSKGDGDWKIVPESEPAEFMKFRMLPSKDHKDQTFIDCELVDGWKITEQDQVDIVIPGDVLFHEKKSNDEGLVISAAHLWECCNKNSHMDQEVKEGTLEIKGNGVLGKQKFSKVETRDLRARGLRRSKPEHGVGG